MYHFLAVGVNGLLELVAVLEHRWDRWVGVLEHLQVLCVQIGFTYVFPYLDFVVLLRGGHWTPSSGSAWAPLLLAHAQAWLIMNYVLIVKGGVLLLGRACCLDW